ncbi:hypothetical protein [Bifidobacterium callitrichos]|uniref:Putative portal protein n=1 Tax=Bifidobacterium callitrichos DSM 23973 TaxID=1437609 RepID=A0A087ACU6_9BIFI|nr:hypothetical protein [Bifidobacterium callitrichos]KFI56596.1 putative portal protein [Bifidobacterium callitrichos DSM 23973]
MDYVPRDTSMLIDGRPLSDWACIIGSDGVQVAAVESRTSYVSVPGRHGRIDQTLRDPMGHAYDDGRDITINLTMLASAYDRPRLMADLGGLHGRHVAIAWPSMWLGEYRGTLQVGEWQDVFSPAGYVYSSGMLTLHTDDALQHGRRTRVTLAWGTNRFSIDGNRPAWPVITLQPDPTAETVSIAIGGRTIAYRFTRAQTRTITSVSIQPAGEYTGSLLTIDCAAETSTYGSNPIQPTLDSDYPMLSPRLVEATVTGAGGWIEYEPLWLM